MDELQKGYLPFQCMIITHLSRYRVEGIPTAQYEILDILSTQGSKTAGEISRLRGVSMSGISKLIKVLLEKGYVVQERSSSDRRCYDISITEEGNAFLERSEQFRGEILAQIRKALNHEEIRRFSALCEKIAAQR